MATKKSTIEVALEELAASDARVKSGRSLSHPEGHVVNTAVDGCVIDWARGVQVNPQTGQTFDFDGHLL